MPRGAKPKPARDRFLSKVDQTQTCWIWLGSTNGPLPKCGYGRFFNGKKLMMAHRFSYETFVEKIPKGFEIDHLCRNRLCVNPAHLEAVLHRENVLRGKGTPASNIQKTHCKRGHEFSRANTKIKIVKGRTIRQCGTCLAEWRFKNRERLIKQRKQFHEAHPDYQKNWIASNRERSAGYSRKYRDKKLKS